jgi:hypothetical protein
MKQKFLIIALALALLFPSSLWALTPGSCVQTVVDYAAAGAVKVSLVCTGSPDDGALPTQTIDSATVTLLTGHYYLYQVKAYPTSGGTAPDAADVAVLMDGMDLLGAKGVNLIHATATYDTFPYSAFMSSYRFPAITGTVTLTVANQATHSANYTIELVFVK